MENGLWDPNFSRSIKLRAIKWRRAVPLVEPLDYLGRVERQIGKAAAISDYHTYEAVFASSYFIDHDTPRR
jgi:hypothetical protein